jgi:hypothetical protein
MVFINLTNPKVYPAFNTNNYHKQKQKIFLASTARPVSEADNLTAICEPSV